MQIVSFLHFCYSGIERYPVSNTEVLYQCPVTSRRICLCSKAVGHCSDGFHVIYLEALRAPVEPEQSEGSTRAASGF